MHRLLIAAAAAGGLLTMPYALTPAQAAPLSPVTAAAQPNVVTPVAQGMRGGGMGMRGGGMPGMGSRGLGSRGMGIGRPGIGGAGRFAYRGVPRRRGCIAAWAEGMDTAITSVTAAFTTLPLSLVTAPTTLTAITAVAVAVGCGAVPRQPAAATGGRATRHASTRTLN